MFFQNHIYGGKCFDREFFFNGIASKGKLFKIWAWSSDLLTLI